MPRGEELETWAKAAQGILSIGRNFLGLVTPVMLRCCGPLWRSAMLRVSLYGRCFMSATRRTHGTPSIQFKDCIQLQLLM